jgi:hypothetical protein
MLLCHEWQRKPPHPPPKKEKLQGIIPLTPKIILCMKEFWDFRAYGLLISVPKELFFQRNWQGKWVNK